jgi:hypothetical protein
VLVLLLLMMLLLFPIMMQRNTIKLLKRIRNFAPGSLQIRVERNTLHIARGHTQPFIHEDRSFAMSAGTEIHGGLVFAFFDVAEVYRVDAAAGVGDDRGFHVAQ